MRVAATDYDGTLYIDGRVGDDALGAIRLWRERGNAFGIATGRCLALVNCEIERWGIPFDFLVCVNGAAIYDDGARLLGSAVIPNEFIADILRHPSALASYHYGLSMDDGSMELCVMSPDSWFLGRELPYRGISFDESLMARELHQISFGYGSAEESASCAEALIADFGDAVEIKANVDCIDITGKGIDKEFGISRMLSLRGWPSDGILVIGDGGNDLGMIRAFNGCTVESAGDDIKKEASAVYGGVGEMLIRNM
jgi:hydroxymethylpyrimidine pyrophosphatase-like HAD family hydrolase